MGFAKPVMYYHHAGLTDTGLLRSHNEDAFKLPLDLSVDTLAQKGYFYVLADGMGGHQKGEVASAVTIETAYAEYYASVGSPDRENPEKTIIEAMVSAIEQANLQVMEATEGGGTTIVAATLYDDHLVIMNIGDSRAYLLRDGELRLVSRDHSLVSRLLELGKITDNEAANHPRQNVLYQALGQGSDLEVHVYTDKMQLGDTIILCSDGLWGPLGDEAIKEVLGPTVLPRVAVERLVEMANAAGGPDNITTIIIKVCDQEPTAEECISAGPGITEVAPDADDTHPTLEIRIKPDTLPEGKFYVVRNQPEAEL